MRTHTHPENHLNTPDAGDAEPTPVDTFIDTYESNILTTPQWEAFGSDIARLVKATDPVGEPSASKRLWALSAYVPELLDRGALTVDGDLVDFLDEGWFEEVIADPRNNLVPMSLAAMRASLYLIGEAEHPHLFPARLELPRRARKAPLSATQVESAMYAKEYLEAPWDDMFDAVLPLADGAAASPSDLYVLRRDHFAVDGHKVVVTLTGLQRRTVAVADKWAATVAERLERVGDWWLTGTEVPPHRNHLHELCSRVRDRSDSEFSVDRLRTGCMVGWVQDDLPVDVLRYRAGLKTLSSIERVLEFVDRDPSDWEPPAVLAAPVVRPHLRTAGGAA